MVRIHIWRYDDTTPKEERPWIVSMEGLIDPVDFETFDEAVDFVRSYLGGDI